MNFISSNMGILMFAATAYALASVFRFSCYAGIIDRPLFIAILWGLAFGNTGTIIPLGIFFELLWLNLIGAGTYIPPNATLSLLLCCFLSTSLHIQNVPLLPILLAIPCAYLGAKVENFHRQGRINTHFWFVEERQMKKRIGVMDIAYSVLLLWGLQLALFILLAVIIGSIVNTSLAYIHIPLQNGFGWPVMWLAAGLGGILSLRIKKAYVSFLVTFAFCAAAFTFFK